MYHFWQLKINFKTICALCTVAEWLCVTIGCAIGMLPTEPFVYKLMYAILLYCYIVLYSFSGSSGRSYYKSDRSTVDPPAYMDDSFGSFQSGKDYSIALSKQLQFIHLTYLSK